MSEMQVSAKNATSSSVYFPSWTLLTALAAYWAGILLWTSVVPPVPNQHDGCPTSASEAVYLMFEIVFGVFVYDFIFFWIHLAMHKIRAFGKAASHSKHHAVRACPMSAIKVLDHSLVDGTFQVLLNN